jgi:3-oxoadipate enol-lactonase
MATSEIRGCEIAYEQSGTGMDMVWGHGLTQSRALEDQQGLFDWAAVPANVLRYDARGHGESQSTSDLDGYRWQHLAADQLELATAVGVDIYLAGGASMGAATALHAAVAAPRRIVGLVLVIPPTGWEARAGQADVYEQGAKVVETFGVEPLIKAGGVVPPPDPFVGDPEYRTRRASGLRSWDPQRLAHVMRGAARAQLPDRERIAEITCPTLILAWTGDPAHPVASADALGCLLPQAEQHIASTAAELGEWSRLVADFVGTCHR